MGVNWKRIGLGILTGGLSEVGYAAKKKFEDAYNSEDGPGGVRSAIEKMAEERGMSLEEFLQAYPSYAENYYDDGVLTPMENIIERVSETKANVKDWFKEKKQSLIDWYNENAKDKVDALIDNVTGERDSEENEKNRQFQHDEAEINRSWEAEQARQAREWDSIGSQMERASAVGVNPISIAMQNGGINSSATTSIPSAPSTPAGSSGLMHNGILDIASMIFNGIGTLAENRLKQTQSDDIVAMRQYNIAEKMANTDHLRSLADSVGLSNVAQQIQNDWLDRLNQATYDNMLRDLGYKDSEILKNRSVAKLNLQQRSQIRQDMELTLQRFNATLPLELQLTEAEINLKNASVKEVYEEISLRHLQAIEQENRNRQSNAEAGSAEVTELIARQTYEDAINAFHNDMVRGAAEAGIRLNDYLYYGASPIPAGSMPSMLINSLSSRTGVTSSGNVTDRNVRGISYYNPFKK